MLREIVISGYNIEMNKVLWQPNEIETAQCLGFEVNNNTIICDMRCTAPEALKEFLDYCFKSFMTSPMEVDRKAKTMAVIKKVYQEMFLNVGKLLVKNVPYTNMFYRHQVFSLERMAYKKCNLLSLSQGLGKSCVSASLSRMFNIPKTIIICPAIVKWSFYRDLTETFGFNPLYFTILDASQRSTVRALFEERFIIINYEMVKKHMAHLIKEDVGHIIIDEAQALKNSRSQRFHAISDLVDYHKNARLTLMSGTPVKNRVNDMFAYLKLMKHPLGSNYAKFLRDFTHTASGKGGTRVTGGKNLDDLQRKISNLIIRKTKEECLDLPPKIITKCYFELNDYREEYNNVLKDMVENQGKNIGSINGSIHTLNIITAKSKINGIIEMAENIIDQERKVVIFGSYTEPLAMLQHYFGNRCVLIDGSVPAKDRDNLIQRFLHDDKTTVFLGNMIAAGIGINLVNSSDIIYTNFPFTPSELEQSMDRSHRIGQVSSVNVYYTIGRDSLDEKLFNILSDKAGDISALIDKGNAVVPYTNVPEMLFKELAEQYNKLETV